MKKYEWNVKELINIRNMLKKTVQKNNLKNKDQLQDTINTYDFMLQQYDKRCKDNCTYDYNESMDIFDFVFDYIPDMEPSRIFLVANAIDAVKNYYQEDINYLPYPLYINNDSLIELTSEIYKSINVPSLYKEFQNIISKIIYYILGMKIK